MSIFAPFCPPVSYPPRVPRSQHNIGSIPLNRFASLAPPPLFFGLWTMPAFNLSWKGRPHGRSGIRSAQNASAEPSSPSQPSNPSTQAAHDVFKKPMSPHISRLRRAQQALIGRRRRVSNRNTKVRVSFVHSSTSSGLPPSATRNSVNASSHPSKTGEVIIEPGLWST